MLLPHTQVPLREKRHKQNIKICNHHLENPAEPVFCFDTLCLEEICDWILLFTQLHHRVKCCIKNTVTLA